MCRNVSDQDIIVVEFGLSDEDSRQTAGNVFKDFYPSYMKAAKKVCEDLGSHLKRK